MSYVNFDPFSANLQVLLLEGIFLRVYHTIRCKEYEFHLSGARFIFFFLGTQLLGIEKRGTLNKNIMNFPLVSSPQNFFSSLIPFPCSQ